VNSLILPIGSFLKIGKGIFRLFLPLIVFLTLPFTIEDFNPESIKSEKLLGKTQKRIKARQNQYITGIGFLDKNKIYFHLIFRTSVDRCHS
jgi:hypothetical protein